MGGGTPCIERYPQCCGLSDDPHWPGNSPKPEVGLKVKTKRIWYINLLLVPCLVLGRNVQELHGLRALYQVHRSGPMQEHLRLSTVDAVEVSDDCIVTGVRSGLVDRIYLI